MHSVCSVNREELAARNNIAPLEKELFARMDVSLRRYYVDRFCRQTFAGLPPGVRVADLGGHRDTKRGGFDIRQQDVLVVCVNLSDKHGADVIADVAHVPLEDGSFDVVVCSELLEHVPSPRDVLIEAVRILRPGGWFVACSPFLYHIHADPHDFGRYTDYYWEQVLAEVGFEQIETERQGGFWSVVVDMFRQVLNRWDQNRRWRMPWTGRLMRSAVHLAKSTAVRWDRPTTGSATAEIFAGFATGFGMTARKPIRGEVPSPLDLPPRDPPSRGTLPRTTVPRTALSKNSTPREGICS